ncbi:MAG TPA: site-2 protease family protein [Candidatus Paceibacterota bacterium]|nr:site-2 protease family protein [Candidatus Paceibacterota bacterium]
MLIIIIVIVGLSLLILTHEAGHFWVAKLCGLKVDEFGFGFPPRIKAWKRGETEYSVNWLPFGGFVRISGERGETAVWNGAGDAPRSEAERKRLFFSQPAWKKSVIVLAGVFVNFIIGWLLISAVLMIGTPQALIISGIQPDSPAAQAGIMAGDVVKGYATSQSFIDYINAHRGEPTAIAVLRNDKEIDFTVTPRAVTAPDQGAVGVELEDAGAPREAPLPALWDGLLSAGLLFWLTLAAFGQLVAQLFTHGSLLPGVVGPVGIVSVAEEAGKIGLTYLIQFIGLISINLTVVNLIPFPALDGGRFLMVLIEKIKGSAVPEKFEAWVNGIGFALLILLMVALTVRDVGGLI